MVTCLKRPGVVAALICCLCAGCQRDQGVEVSGTVTFDGQPVEQGAISFVAAGDKAPSQGAVITKGTFQARVTPGSKRVEIRASRPKKPDKRDPDSANLREDFIPAKYNSASTLTAEISAEHENVLKFDLTAK